MKQWRISIRRASGGGPRDCKAADRSRLTSLFRPDYRSEMPYLASTGKLRAALAASIGYPPPGKPGAEAARFDRLGEDTIGTYFRAHSPVLPGVH